VTNVEGMSPAMPVAAELAQDTQMARARSAHLGTVVTQSLDDNSITFIGTATVLVRLYGFTVLTDPNFLHRGQYARLDYGLRARRRTEPALHIDELPPLDLVVLSHFHEDHFDRIAQRRLDHSTQLSQRRMPRQSWLIEGSRPRTVSSAGSRLKCKRVDSAAAYYGDAGSARTTPYLKAASADNGKRVGGFRRRNSSKPASICNR
jgi:hypothetical protein